MFFQVILVFLTALILGVAVLFADTIRRVLATRRELIKSGNGLKIVDKFSIWAGNINTHVFKRGLLCLLSDEHARLNTKTFALLYGYKKAVSTIDLDLIKRVVVDNLETNRIEQMSAPFKEVEYDCIMTAKGEQWRRIRRAIAPALKSNKFKTPNVQREIESSINKLIKAIECKLEAAEREAKKSVELNIDDYAHRYSLDLVFSCFYKQSNLIDFQADFEPMTRLVDSGFEALMLNPVIRLCVIFPRLRPIIDWLIMNCHPQGVWRRMIMEFIKRQTKLNFEARKHVEQLKRSGSQLGDEDNFLLNDGTKFSRNMIDHVIDQFYESKLTRKEYFHSTWFLLGAADRTSSDAIAHTIYQLATHERVQDKLRQEILDTTKDGATENSEYLSWVINESLRLLPPAPIGCTRTTSRDYKCDDGGVVPAGTLTLTPAYTIHRLPEYWGQDAEEFRPERFAQAKSFHPMQFIPFGAGARACPGKEFAIHEMKKVLCALLTRYKFHCEPMKLTYNSPWLIFTIPDKHVHVTISRV